MTNKDRQRAIRARMAQTGEPYSVAARRIADQRAAAPPDDAAAQAHADTSNAEEARGADDQMLTEDELAAFRARLEPSFLLEAEAKAPHACPQAGPVCGNPAPCPACRDRGCRALACPEGRRAAAQIAARLDPGSLASAWTQATLDDAVDYATVAISSAIFDAISGALQHVAVSQVRLQPAQTGLLRVTAGPPLDATEISMITRLPVAALAQAVSADVETALTSQVIDGLEDAAEGRASEVMQGR
jgi:hypothetical protein